MCKVKVENLKQLEVALTSKTVSEIILSRDCFAEHDLPKLVDKIKKSDKLAWLLMERISRFEENMKPYDLRTSTDKIYEIENLDGIIIQNLDSFAYMLRRINKASNENLKVELNYTMNCYNDETKKVHQSLYNERRKNASEVPLLFTAPIELNIYELSEVGYDTFILYSFVDTMVTANCVRKNISAPFPINLSGNRKGQHSVAYGKSEDCEPTCKYRFNFENVPNFSSYIIDRKGKKLYYKTYCKYCYNKIFNTEPLYLLDRMDDIISRMHCTGEFHKLTYRIDFSFENENEVRNILNKKIPESFTRGHFKNSIK